MTELRSGKVEMVFDLDRFIGFRGSCKARDTKAYFVEVREFLEEMKHE